MKASNQFIISQKERSNKVKSMPTLPRKISSLGIYHVIYRGVNKQRIFEDDDDYGKFLTVLRKFRSKCDYKILGYCLMSNHIHLIIKTGKMSLGRIFQHIAPSFVYWYNKKYARVGCLFQSRFKSTPINSENQLLIVTRYVHQNPVKASICKRPAQYKYSSFMNYFDNDLIDNSFVRSIVSCDDFYSFNCIKNDDHCMDIDDEKPRMNDSRAAKIMHKLSGCKNVTEFQALAVKVRDEMLRRMRKAGISISQSSRITGISYGVVRKATASVGGTSGPSS